jgi:hypothetical protein
MFATMRLVSSRSSSFNVFIISMDPSRTSIAYSKFQLIRVKPNQTWWNYYIIALYLLS